MQKKVEIRLKNLFPQLHGIDFDVLYKLGQKNLSALIYELKNLDESNGGQSHQLIQDCEAELQDLDPGDILRISELGAQMGYLSLRINTFKLLENNLKSQLNQAKKYDILGDYPVLPVLRNPACFTSGDDVMVFVGKTNMDNKHDKLRFDTVFKWMYGKIITWGGEKTANDNLFVYTSRPVLESECFLDGHVVNYSKVSPLIFKKNEFFRIRRMILNNEDREFVLNFLDHCYRHVDSSSKPVKYGSEYFNDLRKIIVDPSVWIDSNSDLSTYQRDFFHNILLRLKSANVLQTVFDDIKRTAQENGYIFTEDELA